MKFHLNLEDSTKETLWFLIYPLISMLWLICLTCSRIDMVRDPDVYNNNYELQASSVTINTPIQIIHDTIYIDVRGSIIKEKK